MSKPIIRHDDGKAHLRIRNDNKHLPTLQSECTENDNISSQHLGRKGLHLNPKDKGRLALNLLKQIQKLLIGYISINLIRNKLESLVKYVGNNLDILMVSDTKIDYTFSHSQFFIEGFCTSYRLDRTAKGGGSLLYIGEDIPSKYLSLPL